MSKITLTVPDEVSIDVSGGGKTVLLSLTPPKQRVGVIVLKTGIKGDKGDSGRSTIRYDFSNSQTVQVNHSLGFYPVPMVFNSNGDLVLVTPRHINNNRFDLTFNEPITGYVIY